MVRIVVTGGSGFIGANLVQKLLENPENEVIVFDNVNQNKVNPANSDNFNLNEFKNKKNYSFIQGDITNIDSLKSVLTKDIDQVYHLAAVVGIKHYINSPLKLIDVNVIGTKNLLELAAKNEIKVLFTSTSEVYGKNPKTPWKETDDRVLGSPSIDRWNYSTSKALGEHMVNAVHKVSGLPTTIVRYFNIYGPMQQPYFVVSQSIHKVLNNKKPLLYDSGSQTRCFTFVDDAVQGTILATNHPRGDGETFNIGSNKEVTITEVISQTIEIAGKKGLIEPESLDTTKHYGKTYEDIIRRVPDVTKAKDILNWEATTSLSEGLKKTIEWSKNNPWWLALPN